MKTGLSPVFVVVCYVAIGNKTHGFCYGVALKCPTGSCFEHKALTCALFEGCGVSRRWSLIGRVRLVETSPWRLFPALVPGNFLCFMVFGGLLLPRPPLQIESFAMVSCLCQATISPNHEPDEHLLLSVFPAGAWPQRGRRNQENSNSLSTQIINYVSALTIILFPVFF